MKKPLTRLKYACRQSKKLLKEHLIDTTAALCASNPMISAFEVLPPNNFTDQESIYARITGSALFYLGMGSILSRGRDLSEKVFNVTKKSSEKVKCIHDALYGMAFGFAASHVIYPIAECFNDKPAEYFFDIFIPSCIGAAVSVPITIAAGYSIDAFRDLTGWKDSERLPDLVKRQNPSVKKGLAALLVAGQVAAMAGIYSLTN